MHVHTRRWSTYSRGFRNVAKRERHAYQYTHPWLVSQHRRCDLLKYVCACTYYRWAVIKFDALRLRVVHRILCPREAYYLGYAVAADPFSGGFTRNITFRRLRPCRRVYSGAIQSLSTP